MTRSSKRCNQVYALQLASGSTAARARALREVPGTYPRVPATSRGAVAAHLHLLLQQKSLPFRSLRIRRSSDRPADSAPATSLVHPLARLATPTARLVSEPLSLHSFARALRGL